MKAVLEELRNKHIKHRTKNKMAELSFLFQ